MLWRLSVMMMSDSYSMYAKPWDPQYQRRTEQSERNEIKSKHEWFMAQFRYSILNKSHIEATVGEPVLPVLPKIIAGITEITENSNRYYRK